MPDTRYRKNDLATRQHTSPGRPPRSDHEIDAFRKHIGAQALGLYLGKGADAVSMREIARTAGCSPATLYAHFAGKADILLYLWAYVLDEMIATIEAATGSADGNALSEASHAFVDYWTANPERFRLVFMSAGVVRADVSTIMSDPRTKGHFDRFRDLLARAVPVMNSEVRARTDTLVAGLIGVSLCLVTIKDHDWPAASEMVDQIVRGATAL